MTRGRAQGARGPKMANGCMPRVRASHATYEGPDANISPFVEDYAAIPKCKGLKYKLKKRRAEMKGKMILKSGSTGVGCVEGCVGTIVRTLTEAENALINSMTPVGGDSGAYITDDFLLGDAMVKMLLL